MNLLIIGATRGIGRELLQQALTAGFRVTVLARDPRGITARHERLKVLRGDILDQEAVSRAMSGQEAVCCCIGVSLPALRVRVFSEGTKNVLFAMHEAGVRRLVCVTGVGAGDSRGHGGFLYDTIVRPVALKAVYDDKDRQEALIQAADVDWTIVRPGFLTNEPASGEYRVLTDLTGVTAGPIARADVARFIIEELKSNRYIRQTPLLTR